MEKVAVGYNDVISRVCSSYWTCYQKLDANAQRAASDCFARWQGGNSAGIQRTNRDRRKVSADIGIRYRSVGIMDGNLICWYWVGSHEDYNRIIDQAIPATAEQCLQIWKARVEEIRKQIEREQKKAPRPQPQNKWAPPPEQPKAWEQDIREWLQKRKSANTIIETLGYKYAQWKAEKCNCEAQHGGDSH